MLGAAPILRGKGVEGERLHAGLARGLQERREYGDAGAVPGRTREPAALGPAPVTVHDDGDVAWGPLWVEAASDARLDGLLGATSLERFQQLDLRELRFLVREGRVDALHVAIRQRLQLGLGPTLVVLGDLAFLAQLVQVAHLVAANVPH